RGPEPQPGPRGSGRVTSGSGTRWMRQVHAARPAEPRIPAFRVPSGCPLVGADGVPVLRSQHLQQGGIYNDAASGGVAQLELADVRLAHADAGGQLLDRQPSVFSEFA